MTKGGEASVPGADGVYTAWVIMSPADDVPGAWTAHALEFDVVTQGDSAEHVYRMINEAVSMFLEDSLRRGVSPARRAPVEDWEPLLALFKNGERVDAPTFLERLAHAEPSDTFAVQVIWLMGQTSRHLAGDKPVAPPAAYTGPHDAHPSC